MDSDGWTEKNLIGKLLLAIIPSFTRVRPWVPNSSLGLSYYTVTVYLYTKFFPNLSNQFIAETQIYKFLQL